MTPPAPETDASAWVPDSRDPESLASAAARCRGCELWEPATRVVFGSGPPDARMLLVGEQPGDREDKEGAPFVGPAGRVLSDALEEAGIGREEVWLTNAVKHFRFRPRGKRRIHEKPDLRHLVACHPWLEAELELVDPDVVVALGASAARSVLGRPARIGAERGRLLDELAGRSALITTHPSALLRLKGKGGFDEAFAGLVADLRVAGSA